MASEQETIKAKSFISGIEIDLDCSNRHEEKYRQTLMDGAFNPQVEIDRVVFNRFVRKGDSVLDGGANIGFTCLLAAEAGAQRICALEPAKEEYGRLLIFLKRLNAHFFGLQAVGINAALKAKKGSAHLYLSTLHNQGSTTSSRFKSLMPDVFKGTSKRETVDSVNIDTLSESGSFDVWKLDIEGAELNALQGAKKTLASSPPRLIYLECYEDTQLAKIRGLLSDYDYSGYRAVLLKPNGDLRLIPIDEDIAARETFSIAPSYVFARDDLQEIENSTSTKNKVPDRMQPSDFNEKIVFEKFTKSQRYASFLYTYLPRLREAALYPGFMVKGEPWRGDVLIRTLEKGRDRKGIFLEFGVYKGDSIRVCARRMKNRKFFGFDSFEGFPDDGRSDWRQDFSTTSFPDTPKNVELVKGWFSDSLPAFCDAVSFDLAFLNIDCDIYSSTVDVITILHQYGKLHAGLPIYFDELLNYKQAYNNELLALFEFLEESGLGFDWVCCHEKVRSLEEAVSLAEQKVFPTWPEDVSSGYRQQAGIVLSDRGLNYSALQTDHTRDRIINLAERMQDAGLVRALD